MNPRSIETMLVDYSATHLICDSAYPLITNSTLEEEAMLYNLGSQDMADLVDMYFDITGIAICSSQDISALSGGQKVVLMALLALSSKATHIVFVNLFTALDEERAFALNMIINKFSPSKSEILQV